MLDTPITFDNVEVIDETDFTFRCRIQGKKVVIGNLQLLPGTTVRHTGDHGRLVLPRWAVHNLGLKEP